jgi:hypothetical protein
VGEGNRDDAVLFLARKLYETMERLDPPTTAEEPVQVWDEISDHSREFYVSCVESLLVERQQVLAALSD